MSGNPRKTKYYFKKIFTAIVNDYVITACKMLFKLTSHDSKMLTHTFTLTATHTDSSWKLLVITWVASIPTTADFVHFIIPMKKKKSLILLFFTTNKQRKDTV